MEPSSANLDSQDSPFELRKAKVSLGQGQPAKSSPLDPPQADDARRDANEKLQTQLEAAREEIRREREQLEHQRREAAGRWEKKLSELERLQSEITGERSSLEAPEDTDPGPREQDDRDSENWRRRPAAEDTEDADQELDEPARRARRRDASSTGETVEEESMESHIAAFMSLLRGGDTADAIAEPRTKRRKSDPIYREDQQPNEPTPPAREPTAEALAVAMPEIICEPVLNEMERRPRQDVTNLSAMREVANAHARTAIHTHSKKQLHKTLLIRSLGAAGCLIGGFIALNLAIVEEQGLMGGAMVGIVLGIYLLFIATKDVHQFGTWFHSRDSGDAVREGQSSVRDAG